MGSRTRWTTAAVVGAASLLLAGCAGGGLEQGGGEAAAGGSLAATDLTGASYTVGSKDFDEQLVLCEITVAALESTGATVDTRNALLAGDIDMYWEYTGTAQVTFFGGEPIQDADEQYQAVKEADLAENQIEWLTPTEFNNTYAFAVLESKAAELDLTTMSDMAAYYNGGGAGPLCVESEYLVRDDGLPGMLATYGFQPQPEPPVLETGAIYQATADPNTCLFGEVFTTDGRIPALDLRVLEDDRTYHPLYNAAVTIRTEAFQQNPAIADVFAPIAAALTNDVMLELNGRKSSENVPERQVARDWLAEQGFIAAS
jgi:osmoprotectant transport system substrate-binding protein